MSEYDYLFGGENIVWVKIFAFSPIRGRVSARAGFYFPEDMEMWIGRVLKEFSKRSIVFEEIIVTKEDIRGIPF